MKSIRKIIDPFLVHLPYIDVHGYDSLGAISVVQRFIEEMKILKKDEFIVIHGKGTGILRESIRNYFKRNREIISFRGDMSNPGITIVNIRI